MSRNTTGYILIQIASGVLGSLFSAFHLVYALEYVKVSTDWFFLSQVVFFVWNSVNDLLGGWICDRMWSKIPIVRYCGLMWAVSFCFAFMASPHWPEWVKGLHFFLSISLVDTWYSFLAIASGGMLIDISSEDSIRLKSHSNANLFTTLVRIPIVYLTSWIRGYSMDFFLSYCMLLGVLCGCLFLYATGMMKERHKSTPMQHDTFLNELQLLLRVSKTLFKRYSFVRFIGMNVMLENLGTWSWEYLAVYFGILDIDSGLAITMASLSSLCSLALQFYLRGRTNSGVWYSYQFSFLLRIGLCGVFMMLPIHYSVAFVVMNIILIDAPASLFPITMGQIIDEFNAMNDKKSKSIESKSKSHQGAFYSLHAVIAKPGNSLLPMLGVYILSAYGYPDKSKSVELQRIAFNIQMMIPLIIGIFQVFIWTGYRLRGDKLEKIKDRLKFGDSDGVDGIV